MKPISIEGVVGLSFNQGNERNISRLLVFKLGGRAELPAAPLAASLFDPPPQSADTAALAHGRQVYGEYCSQCHGIGAVSGDVTPDLRRSVYLKGDTFFDIVLGGSLKDEAGEMIYKPPVTMATLAAKRSWLGRAYLDWSMFPVVEDKGALAPPGYKVDPPPQDWHTIEFRDLRFGYPVMSFKPSDAILGGWVYVGPRED